MSQIISSNTTWTTGTTISLTSNIQIAYGATLTIEPGVTVDGNGFTIQTFGTLDAVGSTSSSVSFSKTNFTLSSNFRQAGYISLDNSNVSGGSFLAPTGNASYGSWSIMNSSLTGIPYIYAWYPTGNVTIKNDTFTKDGGISVGTNGSVAVYIENNTFSGWGPNGSSSSAIENWASYGSSQTIVNNNNFLDVGKIALELPPGYTNAAMSASGNYFGTTDPTVISSMIYDQTIDLNSAGIIQNLNVASSPNVMCFRVGTLIHTPRGERRVEELEVGSLVSTAKNGPRAVKWVGKGKVLATRGKRTAATPVIVSKGALGANIPHHDLHVTKAHSLYIDDVLIPVEFLVNHRTIIWDDRAQEVEIYHVELESHDILLANGVPAESYRDDGNRWLFQNADMTCDAAPQEPYAQVITGGAVVDAVWRRLLERAGPRALPPLTSDPDVHLLVDGVRVDMVKQTKQVCIFELPDRPAEVKIVSRDAVPSELGLARDSRSLGVALRMLVVRQDTKIATIAANDTCLKDGFHDYEEVDNLRWTDGFATVPAEVFSRFQGRIEIVLHLAGTTHYVLSRERRECIAA